MNSEERIENTETPLKEYSEDKNQEIDQSDVLDDKDIPSFDSEIRSFIAHISSLSSTLQLSMRAIQVAFYKTRNNLTEFEKENITYQEINGNKAMLVRTDHAQQFKDLNKKLSSYGLAFKTIPQSYIMALISQYDAFLGSLLKVIFLTKPGLLSSSEKKFTFAQLVEFGSVEDAKDYILEKEIETVLRKSHSEQFDWMEHKFNLPLRQDLNSWPIFIEVTESRNLFVHTGGIVSRQYLKVCNEHDVPVENLSVGDELLVSPEYFEKAFNVVFEIGFKLAQVLWRKFIPCELEEADNNIISVGYDTLHEGKYPLTEMIFSFATETLRTHSCDENRRIMIVNKALANKWSGDDKKAKSLIELEDWSATRARFRLAEAVILDNFEEAYEIMKEIDINHKEVEKNNYREWPLFKEIKKEPRFLELFQEIFGEPYNKVEEKESEELPELFSIENLESADDL